MLRRLLLLGSSLARKASGVGCKNHVQEEHLARAVGVGHSFVRAAASAARFGKDKRFELEDDDDIVVEHGVYEPDELDDQLYNREDPPPLDIDPQEEGDAQWFGRQGSQSTNFGPFSQPRRRRLDTLFDEEELNSAPDLDKGEEEKRKEIQTQIQRMEEHKALKERRELREAKERFAEAQGLQPTPGPRDAMRRKVLTEELEPTEASSSLKPDGIGESQKKRQSKQRARSGPDMSAKVDNPENGIVLDFQRLTESRDALESGMVSLKDVLRMTGLFTAKEIMALSRKPHDTIQINGTSLPEGLLGANRLRFKVNIWQDSVQIGGVQLKVQPNPKWIVTWKPADIEIKQGDPPAFHEELSSYPFHVELRSIDNLPAGISGIVLFTTDDWWTESSLSVLSEKAPTLTDALEVRLEKAICQLGQPLAEAQLIQIQDEWKNMTGSGQVHVTGGLHGGADPSMSKILEITGLHIDYLALRHLLARETGVPPMVMTREAIAGLDRKALLGNLNSWRALRASEFGLAKSILQNRYPE
ncbi:hypothetical protein FVE85_3189 [Porphyridium purpureum]|uniref:Uncharacterized protein n=1 Tax=Porphyridium purpureum TaxID=35688 RepID=A0A5J4YUS0_PORPP|nr:hypothetical protein FVE85_3189 [Porphyridium purpureum]|eukprot:POR1535..scf227_4